MVGDSHAHGIRMSLRTTMAAAILLSALPAAAESKPKLVVMKLVAERGIDESLVRLLNELLLAEFSGMGSYEVLGESDAAHTVTVACVLTSSTAASTRVRPSTAARSSPAHRASPAFRRAIRSPVPRISSCR